jgi:tripartite ATP-independent transporter DctM subunit
VQLVCRVEDAVTAVALLAMALLPVIEMVLRASLQVGIPGNAIYVSNLTLWVGFLGAMVAAREGRHLALAAGLADRLGKGFSAGPGLAALVSATVAAGLAWASLQFVLSSLDAAALIDGWLPEWVLETVLPAAFTAITARMILTAPGRHARLAAVLGVAAAAGIGLLGAAFASALLLPGLVALIVAALFGAPIFAVIGGVALLLFAGEGVPVAAITVETYRLIGSPAIPTIPLFTLTGYVLAQGGTTERLVRLFGAWFGWMPGGLAVAATLVCAFFSTFTGASGTTILALGGLLLPVLIRNGYPERLAVGLLTATGSIGLLFPPSLAVILYGVVAHLPIPDLFVAGLAPGVAMVLAVSAFGAASGIRAGVPRQRFHPQEAAAALWQGRWEVLLPLVALGAIFGGFCTLAEAAALTVVYALLVQLVIRRELRLRQLGPILIDCAMVIGGVFAILGVALGLTNYLVDADLPAAAAAWAQSVIGSRLLFLLVLNLLLLVVGCLMDIFSAMVVILPLILPMAQAFGVAPLHVAMIFLTNLELGYLTPPVGMNLFLASYRLERPMATVCRSALPFLLILLAVVLLVSYAPLLWPGYGAP